MSTDAGATTDIAELTGRLSALGAGMLSGKDLARAAAATIADATGAVEVAIYLDALTLAAPQGVPPRLELLGAARAEGAPADATRRRRMRALALAERDDGTESRERTSAGAPAAETWAYVAQRIALPDAVAVVVAAGAVSDATYLRTMLSSVHGALATVLRLARAEREAVHARGLVAQTRAIFAQSTDAILTVNGAYHIVAVNPAFAPMLDLDDTPVLGAHCRDVLACQDERGRPLCDTLDCPLSLAFANPAAAPYRDLLWRTGTGRRRFVSASFASVPVNDGWRAVIIARDSTPVKAANRMRSNFISMVSHELRTPLNSLNGFLEIVLEGQAGPLRPRQQEFLNYARASTNALMRLVEDIVFISRADTGQFTLRRDATDVAELIAPVLHAHRLAAQHAGLELRAEIPAGLPHLCVDESRIQQVLHNLVMNAIKFTSAPGSVVISAAREPRMLRLAVRDTGPGVAPENQIRIFERFYQSEGVAKDNASGYGLGLAIAKLIVEQHGGRIWVDSLPGAGATFAFTAPFMRDGVPCPPVEG